MSYYGTLACETPEVGPQSVVRALPLEILWGRSYRLEDPGLPGIRLYTFTDVNRMMEHLFAVRRGRSFSAPLLNDVKDSWENACRLGSETPSLPTVAVASRPYSPSKTLVKSWHWRVLAMLLLIVLGSLCGFLLILSNLATGTASESRNAGKPAPKRPHTSLSTIECANPPEVSPAMFERTPAGMY
jgi:hypothetical protein